jgi:predicted regulator of Ras-like GTPase activity (Roadblock/LC7/MglB family)
VDVEGALADLLQLSSQVQAAAVLSTDGSVLGSAPSASRRAQALATAVPDLLERAAGIRREEIPLARIEVRLADGGVFVVTDGDYVAAAVTAPNPVEGLVIYDLGTCLRRLGERTAGADA